MSPFTIDNTDMCGVSILKKKKNSRNFWQWVQFTLITLPWLWFHNALNRYFRNSRKWQWSTFMWRHNGGVGDSAHWISLAMITAPQQSHKCRAIPHESDKKCREIVVLFQNGNNGALFVTHLPGFGITIRTQTLRASQKRPHSPGNCLQNRLLFYHDLPIILLAKGFRIIIIGIPK